MDWISSYISTIAAAHPIVLSILSGIGIARSIFKPVMSVVNGYVVSSPTLSDKLNTVEASTAYKALVWVFDFIASIKLPGAPK